MSVFYHCDRCEKAEKFENVWGVVDSPRVVYPPRWKQLDGKDLCESCTQDLVNFLQPLPKMAERP